MLQTISQIVFLCLLIPNKIFLDGSCDIFLYNKVEKRFFLFMSTIPFLLKCPLPPVTITINIDQFCRDAKKHVDCVNRRVENCTEVQEYGPALGRHIFEI